MASGTAKTFFPLGASTGFAIFGFLLTQYLSYELPTELLRLQGICSMLLSLLPVLH
ncbi:TPA: hypothetical protein R4D26_000861 [Salmonella enterica subsp. enterica serovar Stanley]|nr:hypothetical protein [Salmonella enterica subsp. enterica serovar Stanley]